ncbi:hypothetical protein BQ1740_2530 [Bacillus subtilis]|nr:hypothetical protein BQ1740_2530 [Bacillus subtilis]
MLFIIAAEYKIDIEHLVHSSFSFIIADLHRYLQCETIVRFTFSLFCVH